MWGDRDFDWQGLDDAISMISRSCTKAHISIDIKEKYGCIRFSVISFFDGSLTSWIQPGRYNLTVMMRPEENVEYKDDAVIRKKNTANKIINNVIIKPVNKLLSLFSAVDRFIGDNIIPDSFKDMVVEWQKSEINDAFQRACLKHPALVNEIVSEIDCPEIIKPNNICIVDGVTIHNKYWS